jgi:regulator of protease activity HflC (stomatin/prohibitin superfamily)
VGSAEPCPRCDGIGRHLPECPTLPIEERLRQRFGRNEPDGDGWGWSWETSPLAREAAELIELARSARLHCIKPGGRFGEDACGTCSNCRLHKRLDATKGEPDMRKNQTDGRVIPLRGRGDGGYMSDGGIVACVVAVIAVLVLGGIALIGAWGSVPSNRIGLHYTGGPIEGQKFAEIIPPGSGARFLGVGDTLAVLPIDQRSYTTCHRDNVDGDTCDGPDIVAATKGGAEMKFRIGVSFKLNTGDKVIRQFYEQICRKYDCASGDGWDDMLQVVFRGPIEQAIQQSVRNYTVDQLFAGVDEDGGATSILEDVQAEIAADLKENINQFVGGAYFCGPGFDRSKAEVCQDFQFQITDAVPTDEGVRAAFAANLASAQDVITAENEADAEVAEAEGRRRAQEALQGLYTDPAYIAYLEAQALQTCAANSNCTLVMGSGSGGVLVGPRSG